MKTKSSDWCRRRQTSHARESGAHDAIDDGDDDDDAGDAGDGEDGDEDADEDDAWKRENGRTVERRRFANARRRRRLRARGRW